MEVFKSVNNCFLHYPEQKDTQKNNYRKLFFFNFCIHAHNRKVGRNASVVGRRQVINSRMEQRTIARLGML